MTQPSLACSVPKAGRHYPAPPHLLPADWTATAKDAHTRAREAGCTLLPSITNIIGTLDSGPGLLGWSAEMALQEIWERRSFPPQDADPDVVADWMRYHKWACNRKRNKAADRGTRAHTIAERLATDTPLPTTISDEDAAYADAFLHFTANFDPVFAHVETTVYGDGYAGTGDFFGTASLQAGRFNVIADYKTKALKHKGKPPYNDNVLQLAALANANEAWIDGQLRPVPTVDVGLVVNLFPDGTSEVHDFTRAELDQAFVAFCRLRDVWQWINREAVSCPY